MMERSFTRGDLRLLIDMLDATVRYDAHGLWVNLILMLDAKPAQLEFSLQHMKLYRALPDVLVRTLQLREEVLPLIAAVPGLAGTLARWRLVTGN